MKARLIRKSGKKYLLYADGTMDTVNDSVLRNLFTCYQTIDKVSGTNGTWNDVVSTMEEFEGNTMVWVDDSFNLCIKENIFLPYVHTIADEEYITLHEYAVMHNKTDARIKVLCQSKRLIGASKKAGKWFIPKNAPYPKDARYSGIDK